MLSYSQTECGKGKCPYDPLQKTASTVVGELASRALQILSFYRERYQLFLWFRKSVDQRFCFSRRQIVRLTTTVNWNHDICLLFQLCHSICRTNLWQLWKKKKKRKNFDS